MKKWLIASLIAACAPASVWARDGSVLAPGAHRIQQVAFTTSDLDRAISFYRDGLGLQLLFVANNMAFFDLAGTRLMIALDRARVAQRPQSILYLDAPDFEAAVARLTARGIRREGRVETVQSTASGALRLQQFVDPDGNALALMGLVPAR